MDDWKGLLGALMVGGASGYQSGKEEEWKDEAANLKSSAAAKLKRSERAETLTDAKTEREHETSLAELKITADDERAQAGYENKIDVANIGAASKTAKAKDAKEMSNEEKAKGKSELRDDYEEWLMDNGFIEGERTDDGGWLGKSTTESAPSFEEYVNAKKPELGELYGVKSTTEEKLIGDDTVTDVASAISAVGSGATPPTPVTSENNSEDVVEPRPIVADDEGVISRLQTEDDQETKMQQAYSGDTSTANDLQESDALAALNARSQKRNIVAGAKKLAEMSSGSGNQVDKQMATKVAASAGLGDATTKAIQGSRKLGVLIDQNAEKIKNADTVTRQAIEQAIKDGAADASSDAAARLVKLLEQL